MSAPRHESTYRPVAEIQSRFLVKPETFPPDIATLIKGGLMLSEHVNHGYTPGGRRYTERTLASGDVVFEKRSLGSTPLDHGYHPAITAEVRTRRLMSQEEFDAAWTETEGQRVSKTSYPLINLSGPSVRLDVFESRPDMEDVIEDPTAIDGKMLAVVQFETVEQGIQYVAPDFDGRLPWLGKNVNTVVSSKKLAQGRTWHLTGTANIHSIGQ